MYYLAQSWEWIEFCAVERSVVDVFALNLYYCWKTMAREDEHDAVVQLGRGAMPKKDKDSFGLRRTDEEILTMAYCTDDYGQPG